MEVEFEILIGGAFFLAAALIWHNIRVWYRMQEREAQLKGMQEAINVLEEARPLKMEQVTPEAEAPKIDARDALVEIGGGDVEAAGAGLNVASIAPETPLLRAAPSSFFGALILLMRYSFSGALILLITSAIVVLLAYIFAFEHSPPETNVTAVSTTSSIDTELAVTPPPRPAAPALIQSQGIPASGAAGKEVEAPSLPVTTRSEATPNETEVTQRQPTPASESRTGEGGTTGIRNGALPDLKSGSELPTRHEGQEPPELGIATASTTPPVTMQPVMPAPQPQAGSPSTDARSVAAKSEIAESETVKTEIAKTEIAKTETAKSETAKSETAKSETAKSETAKSETAKTETAKTETVESETAKTQIAKAEPEVQTLLMPSATRPEPVPNDGKAEITIPQPAPQSEMPSTDNRATDDRHSSIAPPVHESEAPVWTRCIVNLIPSGQIAVWTATSYQACISAGTKCAGSRRYANIQFFPQPYLSASSPEQCSTAP